MVTDIQGEEKLTGVEVRDVATGETSVLDVTGLFIAIGHRPNTDLFEGQLKRKENGYLITEPRLQPHRRRGCVRLRRRARRFLSPGGDRRRVGLHGRHRC